MSLPFTKLKVIRDYLDMYVIVWPNGHYTYTPFCYVPGGYTGHLKARFLRYIGAA